MKVAILAGGMGSRLAEETEVKPKAEVETEVEPDAAEKAKEKGIYIYEFMTKKFRKIYTLYMKYIYEKNHIKIYIKIKLYGWSACAQIKSAK